MKTSIKQNLVLIIFLIFHSFKAFSLITIKTIAQNFPPKYSLSNGKMQGYAVDVIKALEKIDPDLKFDGYQKIASIPRIEAELEAGKLDVFVAAFKTPERENKFSFIDIPLFKLRFVMIVRKNDDVNVKSFEDIKKLPNNNIILSVLGTKMSTILKEQNGLNLDEGAIGFSSNLEKLLHERGRFLFTTDLSFSNMHDKEKIRILPVTFGEESQYIMLSTKISNKKKKRLIRAMQILKKSGKLDVIFESYLGKHD